MWKKLFFYLNNFWKIINLWAKYIWITLTQVTEAIINTFFLTSTIWCAFTGWKWTHKWWRVTSTWILTHASVLSFIRNFTIYGAATNAYASRTLKRTLVNLVVANTSSICAATFFYTSALFHTSWFVKSTLFIEIALASTSDAFELLYTVTSCGVSGCWITWRVACCRNCWRNVSCCCLYILLSRKIIFW